MIKTDVVIVGSGPSGISAAIYLKRANIPFVIIEKSMPGGKVALTATVENYPGYKKIDGVELALKFQEQLTFNDIELTFDNILSIKKENDEFILEGDFDSYSAKKVIIATGTKERKLGLDKDDRFYGRGVSFCAICDGSLHKGKEVAVVGGGNSALEEALYLSSIASKVYIVHRRNEFRGDSILVDKIKSTNNIELCTPYIPYSLNGEVSFEGITIKNVENESQKTLNVSSVFVYIGNIPNIEMIKEDVELKDGYILVNEDMETSIEGLYAVGDVRNKKVRQIVTAVNDGAVASLAIEKVLK